MDKIWIKEATSDPEYTFYYNIPLAVQRWELRYRGKYVNQLWQRSHLDGWFFWNPHGLPGEVTLMWESTLELGKAALLRETLKARG